MNLRARSARFLAAALLLVPLAPLPGCELLRLPFALLNALGKGLIKGSTAVVNFLAGAAGKIGGGAGLFALVQTESDATLHGTPLDGVNSPLAPDEHLDTSQLLGQLAHPAPLDSALRSLAPEGVPAPGTELHLIPLADLRDPARHELWRKRLGDRTVHAVRIVALQES